MLTSSGRLVLIPFLSLADNESVVGDVGRLPGRKRRDWQNSFVGWFFGFGHGFGHVVLRALFPCSSSPTVEEGEGGERGEI